MAVQISEHMYARLFRSVPATTAIFQTLQFLLLSSINFLTLLDYVQGIPLSATGLYPRTLASGFNSISHPTKGQQGVASCVKALTKARQTV